jgi:dTDP-4-dehydrorhamnose reductase
MLRDRLPLLVTGIAGVAGFNAFHYLRRRYPGEVFGVRPRRTCRLNGSGVVAQDAEDAAGMAELFRRCQFRSVLNAVGNCALKSCELDPAMAQTVNVASARALADNVVRHGCRLVHLSSDLVFSGNGPGNYHETDPVDPVTVYGKTVAEAEQLLSDRVPGAAIGRISLPMGPSFNRHAGAIDWIQSRFRMHRPATLYFDEVRSCTYCGDLSRVCEWLLAASVAGIFHLGGARPITLYQIGQVVNRVGGYDPHLLKGCPRREAGPIPPRAGNVSMCSDKLINAMGGNPFRPWPSDHDLMPTDRHWHHQRPVGQDGSFQCIVDQLYHGRQRRAIRQPVH